MQADKAFAEKLRYLRNKHGWTQAELASKIKGLSQSYLSAIECGRRPPSAKMVERLSKVFKYNLKRFSPTTIGIAVMESEHKKEIFGLLGWPVRIDQDHRKKRNKDHPDHIKKEWV